MRAARRDHRGAQSIARLRALYLLALVAIAALSIGARADADLPMGGAPAGPAPVHVTLGTPVLGTTACPSGGALFTERIGWNGSTANLTTSDVYLKLVELVDGDYVGGADPPPLVTPTDLCDGPAPPAEFDWYVVVGASGSGGYGSVFSFVDGWTAVGSTPQPLALLPGDSLTLVSVRSYAGDGYGLAVEGASGGPAIVGAVTL